VLILVPYVVLGTPVTKRVQANISLQNQLTKYFGVVYDDYTAQEVRKGIDFESLIRYGRLRTIPVGDVIRTASLVDSDSSSRDNSFVKVHKFYLINFLFHAHPPSYLSTCF
jgi:hypothetical protein